MPRIDITIKSNEDVYMNGVKVSRDNFTSAFNSALSEFSEEEKEIHIIRLSVDEQTKMRVVIWVKNALKENNSLKIHYRSIKK